MTPITAQVENIETPVPERPRMYVGIAWDHVDGFWSMSGFFTHKGDLDYWFRDHGKAHPIQPTGELCQKLISAASIAGFDLISFVCSQI